MHLVGLLQPRITMHGTTNIKKKSPHSYSKLIKLHVSAAVYKSDNQAVESSFFICLTTGP